MALSSFRPLVGNQCLPVTVMLQNCNLLYLSLWDGVGGRGGREGRKKYPNVSKPPARMPANFHLKELISIIIKILKKDHHLKMVKIH